jgi:N-acyl homoserine lactone hydrolase
VTLYLAAAGASGNSRPGATRVIPLTLGWADLPISVSLHGDTTGRRLREPVPAVLVEATGGWALLDTGYNTALIRDPWFNARFFGHDPEVRPELPGNGEPLEQALAAVGLAVNDIGAVAISHLHYDHAGGIRLFTGTGVPVHIQRRELDYGLADHPEPERSGMFRVDYDDVGINWQLADGEAEVLPGVRAVPTPGHTPGHQSFVVDLAHEAGGGGFVFAFDAADLTDNIEQEIALGGFIGCGPEQTVAVIRDLKALASSLGYRLVPGHDPAAWPALTEELSRRWPR